MSITAEKIGKVFARHKRGLHERDSVTAVEMLERDILSLLQQGEPEGWKLVPVEPTKAMLEAGHCYMPVEYTHEFKDGQHRITLKKRHECVSPALAYQAMLSASPLPPATAQGWRPIETAPKDGTVIDLYGTRNGEPKRFPNAAWREDVFGGQELGTFSWHFGRDPYGKFEFTHWMPLPPAPGAETGETTDKVGGFDGTGIYKRSIAPDPITGQGDARSLDIKRDWCIEAAKREGDAEVGAGYHSLPEAVAALSSRQAVLEEAEKSFERIRLLLIQHLQGQAASAFWEAVNARDKIRAMLATTPPAEGETK